MPESSHREQMKINPITLSFAKDAEKVFLEEYITKSMDQIRFSLFFSAFLFSLFGILDSVLAPEVRASLWLIRYGIVLPIMMGVILATYWRDFERYIQLVLAGLMFFTALSIMVMMVIAPTPLSQTYYVGLIIVLMYGYTFIRTRFIWATLSGWLIVLVYILITLFWGHVSTPLFINNCFFLNTANVVGMLASYMIEYSARRDYFHANLFYGKLLMKEATARAEADKALKDAYDHTEQLLAAIPSIIVSIDSSGVITHWNEPAETVFGISAVEAIGQPLTLCPIRWDKERIAEGIRQCQSGNVKVRVDDVEFTCGDGKRGQLGITLTPLMSSNGDQQGILLLGADITERKIMEQQLMRAQKLKSIGELAAGIAHEINTPTQFVGNNIRFLQSKLSSLFVVLEKYRLLYEAVARGESASTLLADIGSLSEEAKLNYLLEQVPLAIQESLDGIERIANIVRSMKEYSHPGGEEKVMTDINRAIASTIAVSRSEWKHVAEVETDFDSDLPLVLCFPAELNQVILNLIVNAAHAIADAIKKGAIELGKILISTRREGSWVCIRVADTGTGIPIEIQDRIFDPFFTTKEMGVGTGQGLYLAHNSIVQRHGGTLTFETEMGKGTIFTIRIPIMG